MNNAIITYAVTVCNELEELIRLLNLLQKNMNPDDQILIQYDSENATTEVLDYLNVLDKLHENHKVVGFPLNNDFGTFKNNLKDYADGIFIFQIDADEYPHEQLIQGLREILDLNKETDLFVVPRINTVDGITDEHIQKWGWKLDSRGWVNFPDFQTRIYRRTSEIEWVGKVHERIAGYNSLSPLPLQEEYCLYHPKNIEKQEAAVKLYQTIDENVKEKV